MSVSTLDQLSSALEGVIVDSLGEPFADIATLRSMSVENDRCAVSVSLHVPAAGLVDEFTALLANAAGVDVGQLELNLQTQITAAARSGGVDSLPGVRNLIAVASGKGGVGKSTTAVNLALGLAAEGARVGLLDADIYGPSQQMMLGIAEDHRPETEGKEVIHPVIAHGLQTMSMGYLVDTRTAMAWRGPMASGALQQMLQQTAWDDLDYLIVDMPPGTGDIQLTLAQRAPVTGAVIVTTPQDIALLDCRKGIEMFAKVDIPVVGVVENMAVHICSNCGHQEHLFGEGGGERIAREYGVEVLGSLPLDISIREQTDGGCPSVATDPDSSVSKIYRSIARRVGLGLLRLGEQASAAPVISITND